MCYRRLDEGFVKKHHRPGWSWSCRFAGGDGGDRLDCGDLVWVSAAAMAGTLLYHLGLWIFPDSICSWGIAVLAVHN